MMGTKIFEFQPFLCPWQLFKEGTCQQIFTDFEHPFSNDHILGLEWTFSKIPKPRINSLVCYSSRKGPRSIATQEVEQYSCSKLVTSGNHYKLESIFKGPYLRPEKKFFQNSKFQNLLWHVANQILINCFLNH